MAIGNASYSLYLCHQFVLDSLASLWMRAAPPVTWLSSAIFMAVALSCCAITGYLCFRFVETPITFHLLARFERSASAERNLTCATS
jgi:peptidoglycan/LPS O-acetylase OafA/YrhL